MLIKQNECTSLIDMYVIFYISSITLEKASKLSNVYFYICIYLVNSKFLIRYLCIYINCVHVHESTLDNGITIEG